MTDLTGSDQPLGDFAKVIQNFKAWLSA
jgi:hypothetical protein